MINFVLSNKKEQKEQEVQVLTRQIKNQNIHLVI